MTTDKPTPGWLVIVKLSLRLPALALLGVIRLYQRTLSPLLPVLTVGACGCRFSPTCSHYAADAIRTHGAAVGSVLSVIRLFKCSPLHPGGFDPVPPRRTRPRCERAVT
jgi:putative membrane protein insertion efficiency factor